MARDKQSVRQFDKEREMLMQGDGSVVERIYSAGEHMYSLWELADGARFEVTREGKDCKAWGRADTRIAGDLLTPEAINLDVQHRRQVEDRIVAACPELRDLPDLGGRVYRSRGQVRLGGSLRLRYQVATLRE